MDNNMDEYKVGLQIKGIWSPYAKNDPKIDAVPCVNVIDLQKALANVEGLTFTF